MTSLASVDWPERGAFKHDSEEMDVPALDLHLMKMLGSSNVTHREFFQAMSDHYGFPAGPFRDPDTLLKVMTQTSLQRMEPQEFGRVLGGNASAMRDAKYARLVNLLGHLVRREDQTGTSRTL